MKHNETAKKRRAYLWGHGAEWLSVLFLILKGYRILERRFKCKSGEIDIVAQKGNMICFIEVKARKNKSDALFSLSERQVKRITKAAQWYIAKNNYPAGHFSQDLLYRFDMMAVEPWAWPSHIKDAWQDFGIKGKYD